jgi:hypothetical protein
MSAVTDVVSELTRKQWPEVIPFVTARSSDCNWSSFGNTPVYRYCLTTGGRIFITHLGWDVSRAGGTCLSGGKEQLREK